MRGLPARKAEQVAAQALHLHGGAQVAAPDRVRAVLAGRSVSHGQHREGDEA